MLFFQQIKRTHPDESDRIRQEDRNIFLVSRKVVQVHDDELEAVQLGRGQVDTFVGSFEAVFRVQLQKLLVRVNVLTFLKPETNFQKLSQHLNDDPDSSRHFSQI